MNQDESLTCLKLSQSKFAEGDFEGALRLAIKAQRMFESSDTTEWLEKVRSSAENARDNNTTEDNDTNVRQRHNVPVKEETINAKESSSSSSSFSSPPSTTTTTNAQNVRSDCNYTKEQVKEVKEFMKRNKEDYYAVLGIPKTATSDEIKKAYKKLALKFHPDKNQAPGADEAFKVISVAVSVLGDEEKRKNFDRFGSSASLSGGNGNGRGFASPFGSHFGHAGFEGEISPEELFNMFFNSAFAQQGHAQSFGAGPGQFFFSTNFHGNNPFHQQQRQARANSRRSSPAANENEELLRRFVQFIPLIIVFFLSIVSSWLFPGDGNNNSNKYADTDHLFSLSPSGKYRHSRTTRVKQVPYYATERFQKYFSSLKNADKSSKLAQELASYEGIIENKLIGDLQKACDQEQRQLANMLKRAKKDQWDEIIDGFKLKSCDRLKAFEK